MIRRLRRWLAELALDRIDAEVARLLVFDGSLSDRPLDVASPGEWRRELRARRLAAVARLEAAGGGDPWPTVLAQPTAAQYGAAEQRRRSAR